MNERIKKLRKALDLTQQEFADRIGVKRNTIATYEIGRNTPLDAVISSICREFGVSEAWLRAGEGEMFVRREPQPLEELLAQLIRGRDITDADRILMKNFLELPERSRQEVITFVSKCAQEISEAGQARPQAEPFGKVEQFRAPAGASGQARTGMDTDGTVRTDEDIEREVEDYRRRLILEKRQGDEPSQSSEGGETA